MHSTIQKNIERSLAYIKDTIRIQNMVEGTRLPTIRQLAHGAGVAQRTMSQAVNILKSTGLISVRKHSGIFLGECKTGATAGLHKWQRVQQRCEQDIFADRFSSGTVFPTMADLMKRYGVSYATMKKAISALEQEKLLVEQNGAYHPFPASAHQSNGSVVFIGTSFMGDKIYTLNSRFELFMNSLEKFCKKRSLGFKPLGCDKKCPDIAFGSLKRTDNAIGYVIWVNGLDRDLALRLISTLLITRKPVAIVDEIGSFKYTATNSNRQPVFFTIAARTAGRQIGAYLHAKGHSTIAFISPCHGESWSKERLTGLRSIFDNIPGSSIYECIYPGTELSFSLKQQQKRTPADNKTDALRSIEKALSKQERLYAPSQQTGLRHIISSISGFLNNENSRGPIRELFKTALNDRSITAWVTVNDAVALHAFDFLYEKGISTPKEIALIGFDNMVEANQHAVTSYDFAFDDMAHTIAAYIIYPTHRQFTRSNRIECEGMVVERGV